MKFASPWLLASLALVLVGCNEAPKSDAPPEYAQREKAMDVYPPSAPAAMVPMAEKKEAARVDAQPRAFVRSADLRFRCRSVMQATDRIERIVANNGGYVELNDLRSQIRDRREKLFGNDSVVAILSVDVWNHMQLRVPNDRLDTVLAAIVPLVAFLDNRTIRAQNVGLELRRADREKKRMEKASARVQNLTENPGKVRDLAELEQEALRREERADAAVDRSEGLREQVELSSVQIALYQHPETRLDTLQRPMEQTWQEPFSKHVSRALLAGWTSFLGLVLWVVAHWLQWAILTAAILAFLRWRRTKKSVE
ncbi:MAG: DUF4349 domain-containing protein [Fibrobacteres bacterium]|nr:DUF4349 domain-containing protein [Fibrobacterota bacterium]